MKRLLALALLAGPLLAQQPQTATIQVLKTPLQLLARLLNQPSPDHDSIDLWITTTNATTQSFAIVLQYLDGGNTYNFQTNVERAATGPTVKSFAVPDVSGKVTLVQINEMADTGAQQFHPEQ